MNFAERARELVSKMTLEERMAQLCNRAPAIERLGVPAYNWWNEALHGVARAGTATVFPQAICMAASFNDELLEQVGDAISDEARAKYNVYRNFGSTEIYQGLAECAPNINIFRDPRWGRGQETFGEDPYLTGRMGAAYVRGMQGNGKSKYRKVDTILKHFAVHSGPEGKRHGFNAVVSEKDLRETYLYAFKYCIDHADAASVMGAYNAVNGEPSTGGRHLVGDILYGEWGFHGYMVSDAGSVRDIHEGHGFTENEVESAAYALNGGCQLNIGTSYRELPQAYERGLVSAETITKACEKLFETRFRLGMFDEDCEYDRISYDCIECDAHRALNLQMARESIVLLKNDGILPLKDSKTVAVIGPNADKISVLLGNYNGIPSRYTTVLRGIQDAIDARVLYSEGVFTRTTRQLTDLFREAVITAEQADVVVLCVGLDPSMEGEEGRDAPNSANCGDRADIELPTHQQELIRRVVAVGKPTVLVNISGSCVNLSYADEHCNAVVQQFYPGAEGGRALADVLFGKVSPSGRLPVTFYRSTDDLPPFEDYSMENRTYKFFKGDPLYAFGHGLTYSNIVETQIDENTVEVCNEGPYDTAYSVLKYEYIPHKSLCGFKKIFLKAGERMTVRFDETKE